MLFWIGVALLAAAVTFVVTRPLLTEVSSADDNADGASAVYRDQLREIDADRARGILSEADAAAAHAEVARRWLRTEPSNTQGNDADAAGQSPSSTPSLASPLRTVHAALSVAVPALSVVLYVMLGAPGMPGQPLAGRLAEPVKQASGNDIVAKVEAALRANPRDGRGWDVIAPVYLAMGRYRDSAEAYATALRLVGISPSRLTGFAKARIRVEDGIVADDARKALEQALSIDKTLREPRFWLAVAKEQDGDLAAAEADYRGLLVDAPPKAAWREAVEARLAAVVAQRANPSAVPSKPPTNANPSATIAAMPEKDRTAFIAQMVDGLAGRLKASPNDPDGWKKLIRSYHVLGRKDDAVRAIADAKSALAGQAAEMAAIDALSTELGLGGS